MKKYADTIEYGLLKKYAQENRTNMTIGERALWEVLRGKTLGVKFLRQFIIGEYIVDFACLEKRIVIEVDGGYHCEPKQLESDVQRQTWLEKQGYRVIRFTNEETEFELNKVLVKLNQVIQRG
jgi:very-short-patch-repair endonuclease